jgi:hypothetical protein
VIRLKPVSADRLPKLPSGAEWAKDGEQWMIKFSGDRATLDSASDKHWAIYRNEHMRWASSPTANRLLCVANGLLLSE